MQARLEIRRFPTQLAVIVLAMAAALVGGGTLGYALRTPTVVSGPTRVIQVPSQSVSSHDDCVFISTHKAC
jgi:hypothetical protein